jgi:AcrR family transcriptional regulator
VTSVAVAERTPGGTEQQTRIVDGALRCIARWGVTKTTVDDIAREAGVGRATLYRLFPGGRDAVLDAVLRTEMTRFFGRLDAALGGNDASLEDAVTTIVCEASRALRDHAALQFLVAHEPEVILPHIAFQQFDAVLRAVAGALGPTLGRWLEDEETSARAAEWVTRIVLSYLVAPSADLDLGDADAARRLTRTYILPGLVPGRP